VYRPSLAVAALAFACTASSSFSPSAYALNWPGSEATLFASLENGDANTRLTALRALSKQQAHIERALRTALEDESIDVRAEALRLAATHRVTSAIPHALDATRSTDALIRNRSCAVIGLAKATTHLSALIRLAGDADAEVRIAAMTALAAWSDDDEASAALAAHVDDAAPNVRARAIALLAEHRGSRAMGAIAGKLQDSNVDVRVTVARALGDLGDKRAGAVLVLGLRDSSADVVRESARSLGVLRAEMGTSALIALLPSRQPATLRAAMHALGRIATPEAISALVVELGRATSDRATLEETPIRRALLSAGDKARLPLENVLASGTFWPATSAAWVLGRMARANGARLAEALRRGRIDAAVALDSLSRVGGEAALLAGLGALRDHRAAVRSAARAAVSAGLPSEGSDGRAVEPLLAAIALANAAPLELAELLRLLGMTRAERAVDTLQIFLSHDDVRLAVAATEGLAKMPSRRAIEALASLLAHRTPEVRLAAAGALRQTPSTDAAKYIVNLLNDEPRVDRTTALNALAGPVSRGARPPNVNDALEHAHGAERGAWLELAVLANPNDLAQRLQTDVATDRRALTQTPWAKSSATTRLARSLLNDGDPAVRTHAAWQLGSLGDASDLPRLADLAQRGDPAAAANATAAFAHLAASDAGATATLCGLATTGSPYVKANALAGLGLIGGKCPAVRTAFAKTQPQWLQLAAANALGDEGCAELRERDESAAHCSPARRSQGSIALVFVYGRRGTLLPNTPFSVQTQNGFIRSGWTDARGAFSQPEAPGEALRLLPSAEVAATFD
jgi:HEAT repeat protein